MEGRLKRQDGSRSIYNAPTPWSEGDVGANMPQQNMRPYEHNIASTSEAPGMSVNTIRQKSQKQSHNRRASWAESVLQQETASTFDPNPPTRFSVLNGPKQATPYVPPGPLSRSSFVGKRNLNVNREKVAAGGARAKTRRRRHRHRTTTRKSRR